MHTLPTPDDIRKAYGLIQSHIRKTPVMAVDANHYGATQPVTLKLEMLQHAGSFKPRGAFFNLLSRDVPASGVAAASGGNHGAAVAYAASKLGIKAKIFVPDISSPAKIDRIRDFGAEVVVKGERFADALELCTTYQQESGAIGLHAYDSFHTICGQGTLGLELDEQMGANLPDTLLVAVGGGGLISGIASWFADRVKIIGVEPENASALATALTQGKPVDVPVSGVAADSLGAKRTGDLVFSIASETVDGMIRLPDDAILKAQAALWSDYRLATEAGGATAFAALMSGAYKPAKGERVGVILCGANVELNKLADLSNQV
ncbi:threonine dehydratase [Cohaesibacter sp. ES.047]|uniref:threonine/serine dehydratase n=1 Tax=Cohaesibacter sp. ES.047 TaxID=1798205 RepID=UPI000BB902B1|nr:threonine/serine dehydratase [Cohaesibacter sp. ES.047]SNY90646.1 threonine dehydratase [Cohaesibacter sp. ES.047]